MLRAPSSRRSLENFSHRLTMLSVLLKTSDMTEELLHALLLSRLFPAGDEDNSAWVQSITAIAHPGNVLSAEAALICEILRSTRHSI
jgi:hypothetical protein